MQSGDSWHCPEHQTDVCQDCGGGISRRILPRKWLDPIYQEERTKFNPPLTLQPDEIELHGDQVKSKRKGSHPAPERMAKEARHVPDRVREQREPPRGRERSRDRFRQGKFWSSELVPIRRDNRGRDWFNRKSREYQAGLRRLLGSASKRSKDYTTGTWMEGLGFSLTQLLRHGNRGPDHRDHARVYGTRASSGLATTASALTRSPTSLPFACWGRHRTTSSTTC